MSLIEKLKQSVEELKEVSSPLWLNKMKKEIYGISGKEQYLAEKTLERELECEFCEYCEGKGEITVGRIGEEYEKPCSMCQDMGDIMDDNSDNPL